MPPKTCGEVATRDACSEIVIGGQTWRYSLSRAAVATQETVILDFGGPGVPTLVGGYLTRFLSDHKDALAGYNVLAVEEPWSLRKPAGDCRSAMSAFYLAARKLRQQAQSSADAAAKVCEIGSSPTPRWGFSAASYRELVTAVRGREKIQYVGFIGQSFGSVRLSYLASTDAADSLKWAALSHPFPVGASAAELVTARATAAEALYASLAKGSGNLSNPAEQSRELPITEFDRLSAVAALGYLDSPDQQRAARDIASRKRPASVAQMSDTMWQRYGSNEVAPPYLAQMDEVCSALTASDLTVDSTVRGVLSMWLKPCESRTGADATALQLGDTRLCAVTSPSDTVTPQALVRKTLRKSSTDVRWVQSDQASHRSTDGLDDCLEWATTPAGPAAAISPTRTR